jgi:CRP-like cAMP-binding protein
MHLPQTSTANALLRSLDVEDYALLEPHFERTHLKNNERLYEPNKIIELVHFPEGAVASIVSVREGDEMIEVGLYGREGFSGSAVVLGAGQSPHVSMIQVSETSALSISSGRLVEACGQSPTLLLLLLRFTHSLTVQAALTAASNAHYALHERLARWLLMCHDRVDGNHLELTHHFISMMLAVRRSGVTVTLHTLEGTGAIRATRGLITVLDRDRLEEIAGDSYGEAEAEYRRLIGPFGKGRHGMGLAN